MSKSISRMRCDCYDGDYVLAWTVVPKDSIGSRRVVFGVGFEDVFAVGAGFGTEFMGIQTRMARIDLQFSQGGADGLESFHLSRIYFKCLQFVSGISREMETNGTAAIPRQRIA